MLKKNLIDFLVILIVFMLDRLSKLIILNLSETQEKLDIYVTSYLNFHLIWNDGIAFGLLSFDDDFYYSLLTLVIVLVSFFVLYLAKRSKKIEKLSYLIVFGGSLGNIFDRLYYKSVPDFIDFHLNNHHWFIFNVADIFITIGILLLIANDLILKKYV